MNENISNVPSEPAQAEKENRLFLHELSITHYIAPREGKSLTATFPCAGFPGPGIDHKELLPEPRQNDPPIFTLWRCAVTISIRTPTCKAKAPVKPKTCVVTIIFVVTAILAAMIVLLV